MCKFIVQLFYWNNLCFNYEEISNIIVCYRRSAS